MIFFLIYVFSLFFFSTCYAYVFIISLSSISLSPAYIPSLSTCLSLLSVYLSYVYVFCISMCLSVFFMYLHTSLRLFLCLLLFSLYFPFIWLVIFPFFIFIRFLFCLSFSSLSFCSHFPLFFLILTCYSFPPFQFLFSLFPSSLLDRSLLFPYLILSKVYFSSLLFLS